MLHVPVEMLRYTAQVIKLKEGDTVALASLGGVMAAPSYDVFMAISVLRLMPLIILVSVWLFLQPLECQLTSAHGQ